MAKKGPGNGEWLGGVKFDVRPDRIDLRDRVYEPPLRSLPSQYPAPTVIEKYLPQYKDAVDNQGKEGACTGFGLAAVINFLLWTRYWRTAALAAGDVDQKLPDVPDPQRLVSPRMLYQMARHYDEWAGEDYEGSSCRGAMKGWHKHGVCLRDTWPYEPGKDFKPPQPHWRQEAAQRPLGSYYRVETDSINDMQSAIFEIGAVYVSARVHDGWEMWNRKSLEAARVRKPKSGKRGGHAFAIVGYNRTGFIVQNSWGPKWGFSGFALLPYEDWLHHATDAWAAALGAPISEMGDELVIGEESRRTLVRQVQWRQSLAQAGATRKAIRATSDTEPWDDLQAYDHSVVQGDDGRPLRRQPVVETAAKALARTCFDLPKEFFTTQQKRQVVIYAHGGLNDEAASQRRIRIMAPYFYANGVFPLFYTWRTGFQDTVERIIRGQIETWFAEAKDRAQLPSGWGFEDVIGGLDRLKTWTSEKWDSAVEAGCRVAIKPVWSDMKQTARIGKDRGGALLGMTKTLADLKNSVGDFEIHLVGHSAGSILHGYLLDLLKEHKLKATTCTLWAPACTAEFALDHYKPAISQGTLPKNKFYVEILSDVRERGDTVGPYRKSLLYLVSQVLEPDRDAALLGMEWTWNDVAGSSPFSRRQGKHVAEWRKFIGKSRSRPLTHNVPMVSNGREMVPIAHGSFDNDVDAVERALRRITGASRLKYPVTNLAGF